MCVKCGQQDCDGCQKERRSLRKTVQIDVYAFGCVYYAVSLSAYSARLLMTCQTFFNAAPFEGKPQYQILRAVTDRVRPERLNKPAMDNGAWQLIQRCWKHNASERPTMQDILKCMTTFVPVKHPSFSATSPSTPGSAISTSLVFPSLLASLNEVSYVVFEALKRLITASRRHAAVQRLTRLPLILHVNCWIYLNIPSLPLN